MHIYVQWVGTLMENEQGQLELFYMPEPYLSMNQQCQITEGKSLFTGLYIFLN